MRRKMMREFQQSFFKAYSTSLRRIKRATSSKKTNVPSSTKRKEEFKLNKKNKMKEKSPLKKLVEKWSKSLKASINKVHKIKA